MHPLSRMSPYISVMSVTTDTLAKILPAGALPSVAMRVTTTAAVR